MTTGHALHTATLLPDGSVLMAGTYLFGGGTLASAELYDPVLGMFRPTSDMTTARSLHTATLLNNGRVLIAGGDASGGVSGGVSISLAELYTPSLLAPAPVLLSF